MKDRLDYLSTIAHLGFPPAPCLSLSLLLFFTTYHFFSPLCTCLSSLLHVSFSLQLVTFLISVLCWFLFFHATVVCSLRVLLFLFTAHHFVPVLLVHFSHVPSYQCISTLCSGTMKRLPSPTIGAGFLLFWYRAWKSIEEEEGTEVMVDHGPYCLAPGSMRGEPARLFDPSLNFWLLFVHGKRLRPSHKC